MTPEIIVNTTDRRKLPPLKLVKTPFFELLEKEIEKIREKTNPVNSWHEGYGILIEEVDELWEEVKKKSAKRDRENMTKELVQIAAVCQKIYEDLV